MRGRKPMHKLLFTLLCVSACALAVENPLSTAVKGQYGMAKNVIMRSADKVPAGDYGFKATDEVRSFGQLVAHVADAQYGFCSAVLGEKSPMTASVEKTKTSKADLVQALKDAFA